MRSIRRLWSASLRRTLGNPLVLAVVTGSAFGPSGAPAVAAEGLPLDERILYRECPPGRAYFIPEKVLNNTPIEQLPIKPEEKEHLRKVLGLDARDPTFRQRWLAEQRAKAEVAGGPPVRDCEVPAEDFRDPHFSAPILRPGWRNQKQTLEEALASAGLLFVGRVVAVVPGWVPKAGTISRVAYLEMNEVLRDTKGAAQASPLLAERRFGGELTVRGVQLCSERGPLYPDEDTQPGDTVLIGGSFSAGSQGLFHDNFEFRVKDGAVMPTPPNQVIDTLPLPLEQVREWLVPILKVDRILEAWRKSPRQPKAEAHE